MKTFSMTHVGMRRETNQDYMYTSEIPVGNLPNLFLVADGMGGHAAGDYASRFTVEKVVDYARQSTKREPVAILREAVKEANELLLAAAANDPQKEGMGTTLVAAVVDNDRLYVANVGDSRLYILNQEKIVQITRDHSLVEEMIRLGEMDKEEAKDHPDKHIITRAIGVFAEVHVDFFETVIKSGDIILMCTDGLTNMVDDESIRQIVRGQRDIVEKTEKLIEAANQNGGRDNITVVIVEPYSNGG